LEEKCMRNRTSEMPAAAQGCRLPPYQPSTALGKRLWEIRSQIIASGEKPLSWDEIEKEVSVERHDPRLEK
jgi:hypothetical protein